jgi:DNA sulfur modification protein DndD
LYKRIREIDDKISELENQKSVLYKKLSSCSSIEEVKLWVQQREANQRLIKTNSEKIGSYKSQIARLDKEITLQGIKLRDSYAAQRKCDDLREKYEYARKAFEIVRNIEEEIIHDVRSRMESETFETFSNLIWKKNTYGRIELNDDYRLRLFHVKGDSCLGSCSAAERELLALAFTLALHRVSHHDSLLFIDTPVGRVSDQNREFFAKALISVSEGKQLILAFTPSEYSSEISKYFDTRASSKNRMFSPDENHTIVGGGV